MQIFKKINNNVALARDAKGRELVVFGKGIGFPAMPYELTDLSAVQRTFYDVNEKYFALLRDIPGEVFLLADDIAADAQDELDCSLSPNLTYALADHLNFAIQRCRDGIALQTPLAYDIRHLYPQEYSLAKQALHQLRDTLHVELPDEEAVSIAMHFITAESEVGDTHSTILTAKVVSEISALVEKKPLGEAGQGQLQLFPLCHASAVPRTADDARQAAERRHRHGLHVPHRQPRIPKDLCLCAEDQRLPHGHLRLALQQGRTALPHHAHPPGVL